MESTLQVMVRSEFQSSCVYNAYSLGVFARLKALPFLMSLNDV